MPSPRLGPMDWARARSGRDHAEPVREADEGPSRRGPEREAVLWQPAEGSAASWQRQRWAGKLLDTPGREATAPNLGVT